MRAVLVALLVLTPSLLLPAFAANATEIVVLLAILAAALTFLEYNTTYPSFVEFRDAPPLNRLRFAALLAMVFFITIICKHKFEPTTLTAVFARFGAGIGEATDFPFSPVRLVILMLPADATLETVNAVRIAAGTAYLIALAAVASFLFAVRVLGWPTSTGAFNVWINLPLFDPTAGGDVVMRLHRDAKINVILGVLLPFMIPALVKLTSQMLPPISVENPQTMIWTISAWAFLPASMIMRGIAMARIADLIEEKRRRAHASAEGIQTA